jgi:CHAD domain-containing protein
MEQRIAAWAGELVQAEVRAFRRARQRFLDHPSEKRLHDVRIAARRLRSLCEDFEGVVVLPHARRLHQLIALMGKARDAAVLRETLRGALNIREQDAAHPLLRDLRKQERKYSERVYTALTQLHP